MGAASCPAEVTVIHYGKGATETVLKQLYSTNIQRDLSGLDQFIQHFVRLYDQGK